jgi:type VI protein secretion system component Hcp
MATQSTDILMLLIPPGGGPALPAESQTLLSSADKMLDGPPKFEKGKFFELESFTTTLQAQPGDSQQDGSQTQLVAGKGPVRAVRQITRDTTYMAGILQPITCTRQIDHASPVLFSEVGKRVFPKAAIVRRKATGGAPKADGSNQMGYFRLDFEELQIIEVTWTSDEDGVKESFQFVCKKATALYRQQTHTGSVVDKQFPPGIWP